MSFFVSASSLSFICRGFFVTGVTVEYWIGVSVFFFFICVRVFIVPIFVVLVTWMWLGIRLGG